MAEIIYSFDAIAAADSRVLILGSMPGRDSLNQHQYYAHKRNAFWPLLEKVVGVDMELPYEDRCQHLATSGVALWDVLKACSRDGSLDSAIQVSSMETNDFLSFFKTFRGIRAVFFNGRKAEEVFRRYVLKNRESDFPELDFYLLPSTSPAHASLSFDNKLQEWKKIAEYL